MKLTSLNLRQIVLFAAFLLFAGSLQAQSKLDILFNKLGENRKTTKVTIAKDMMGLLARQINGRTVYQDDMIPLADQIGTMHMISSKELSANEQAYYDKLIVEYLKDGYKDFINSSVYGNKSTKYIINAENDTLGVVKDTLNFEVDKDLQASFRMCVKPIAKDPTSKYDKISEFIIYTRQKNDFSLIAIEGNIYTFEIMKLMELSNPKGILKQTMEVNGL